MTTGTTVTSMIVTFVTPVTTVTAVTSVRDAKVLPAVTTPPITTTWRAGTNMARILADQATPIAMVVRRMTSGAAALTATE